MWSTLTTYLLEVEGGDVIRTTETSLFGVEGSAYMDGAGSLISSISGASADGKTTIYIPAGTRCLDTNGNPLSTITANPVTPPALPENANVIGLAFDFGPDGATFDPPFTITWTYDPDDLPPGVAEEDLVIAYYDVATGQWVELECTVDPVTHTVTAKIAGFSTYAFIGKLAPAAFSLSQLAVSPGEVAPGEAVTVSVLVANTGGIEGSYTVTLYVNGNQEAEKTVTIAGNGSQTVSFILAKDEPGDYNILLAGQGARFTVIMPETTPPEPTLAPTEPPQTTPTQTATSKPQPPPSEPEGPSWVLIGVLIGGLVVIILIILLSRRRR